MLTLTDTFSHYLFSDLSDYNTFQDASGKRSTPLRTGEESPSFTLVKDRGIWQTALSTTLPEHPFSSTLLLDKPLVIAFYSVHWKNYGDEFLSSFKAIQKEILLSGGELLIISSEDTNELHQYANRLSFNIYHDQDHLIAKKFGIFSEEDPIWRRFSGIDINIPLLATFVIATNGQIIHDHTERDFSGKYTAEGIVSAINEAHLLSQG